jgi:hypothetical protein
MEIPLAFQKLSATRGTDAEGAVPKDTKIIFAIGGYAYRYPFLNILFVDHLNTEV